MSRLATRNEREQRTIVVRLQWHDTNPEWQRDTDVNLQAPNVFAPGLQFWLIIFGILDGGLEKIQKTKQKNPKVVLKKIQISLLKNPKVVARKSKEKSKENPHVLFQKIQEKIQIFSDVLFQKIQEKIQKASDVVLEKSK